MRILLLSDIHSNLDALEGCLAAAPACDLVVNLGDVVGYGANPNEVIERSRSMGKHFVRGNHDKAAAGLMDLKEFNPIAGMASLWTREQLSRENLEWLRGLPQGPLRIPELPQAQFVHGSPIHEDDYVVTARDALEPLMATSIPLTFFGLRPVYKTVGQKETTEMQLREGVEYLINPGSVGQPRDGDWRAAFAVFDVNEYRVSFCRVPYDLKRAQDRILAANLPQKLATRLATGR